MRNLFLILLIASLLCCSSKNKKTITTENSSELNTYEGNSTEQEAQSVLSTVLQDKGIEADIANKRIYVEPLLFFDSGNTSVKEAKIEDNTISVYTSQEDEKLLIKVDQTAAGWTIFVRLPKSETSSARGKSGAMAILDVPDLDYYQISSAEPSIEIYYTR